MDLWIPWAFLCWSLFIFKSRPHKNNSVVEQIGRNNFASHKLAYSTADAFLDRQAVILKALDLGLLSFSTFAGKRIAAIPELNELCMY